MSKLDKTGWVALAGSIVGTVDAWTTSYAWDGEYWPTKPKAVAAGFRLANDTDDFNLGLVKNGKLIWFGWMSEQHPEDDYPSVAEQFGWSS